MATRQEVKGWLGDISEEKFDKILTEMLESGELEVHDRLYYLSEKGHFELIYGEYQYFDYDGEGEVTDVRDHKKPLQKERSVNASG